MPLPSPALAGAGLWCGGGLAWRGGQGGQHLDLSRDRLRSGSSILLPRTPNPTAVKTSKACATATTPTPRVGCTAGCVAQDTTGAGVNTRASGGPPAAGTAAGSAAHPASARPASMAARRRAT
jgi:hypothetical protein